MNSSTLKTKVLEEIDLVPEDKLPQVYDFIHYFRLGLETSGSDANRIMQFAGCWQDMPDDMFTEFLASIPHFARGLVSRPAWGLYPASSRGTSLSSG